MLERCLALPGDEDMDFALEPLARDWPSRYHVDPARRNLLRPVAGLIKGRVLEVGCGCGALTGLLASEAATVLALEGSPRRARITAARHRGRRNLTVLACPLDQFTPTAGFDAIVVVGALEYSPMFMPAAEDAPRAFLAHLRRMLAPGGTLILAIENQMGLSYLGGMAEDHAGRAYVGVEDRYAPRTFRTFGRRSLAALIGQAGFPGQQWYFPFPDYKLPRVVLSETALSHHGFNAGELAAELMPDRRMRDPGPGFAPTLAWEVAAQNGLLADLADSFLVAAWDDAEPRNGGMLAWSFATARHPAFRKQNTFRAGAGAITVERQALHPGRQVPPGDTLHVLEPEPYRCGKPYLAELRRACALGIPDAPSIAAWAEDWVRLLRESAGSGGMLPPEMLDAIPANIVRDREGRLQAFDAEWAQPVPIARVVFRGLLDALTRLSCVLPPGTSGPPLLEVVADVMASLGWLPGVAEHARAEAAFQAMVNGTDTETAAARMAGQTFSGPSAPVAAQASADLTAIMKRQEELATENAAMRSVLLRQVRGAGGFEGYVDAVITTDSGRAAVGWAWDPIGRKPAELVILVVDGRPTRVAPACWPRPDVTGNTDDMVGGPGFLLQLPDEVAGDLRRAEVLAWSDGRQSVLAWPNR